MMKKVIAITCILILCVISSAFAVEGNWRFVILAEAPNGEQAGPPTTVGVSTQLNTPAPYGADISGSVAWVVAAENGAGYTRLTEGKADLDTWSLYVAASPAFESNTIRLRFTTLSNATVLPPAEVGGQAVIYSVTMIDNKGKAGAPANGTVWTFPAVTANNTNVWSVDLPAIKGNMNDAFITGSGYQLAFSSSVEVIPEPSSLLALGGGLMGLAGFVARRRRA